MAAGKPILFLGPSPSHIADILDEHEIGWQIRHGDTEGAIAAIAHIRNTPQAQLNQMGRNAQHLLRERLSQETLCNRFCDRLEKVLSPA
jgi:glycosyltransferase involved in cell wall biosynthesis